MSKSKLFLLGIAGGLVGAALVATPILITNSIQTKNQNELNQAKQALSAKIAEASALISANEENEDLTETINNLKGLVRRGNISLQNIYASLASIKQAKEDLENAMKVLNTRIEDLVKIKNELKLLNDVVKKVQDTLSKLGDTPLEGAYKKDLNDAINKALEVENEKEKVIVITNAIKELDDSASKAEDKYNKGLTAKAALEEAIKAAKEVEISNDAYLASVKQQLNDAIAKAEGALNSTEAKPMQDAATELNNQVEAVKTAKAALEQAHNNLDAKIKEAEAVVINDDAYLANVKTALQTALDTAKPFLENSNVDEINKATKDLNSALTKVNEDLATLAASHDALQKLINDATEFTTGIKDSDTYLAKVKSDLEAAIETSKPALDNTDAAEMDKAKAALETAFTDAQNAKTALDEAHSALAESLKNAKDFKDSKQAVKYQPAVALIADDVITAGETALNAQDVETMNTAKAALDEALAKADEESKKIDAEFATAKTTYEETLAEAEKLAALPEFTAQAGDLTTAITAAKQAITDAGENGLTATIYDTQKQALQAAITKAEDANAKASYDLVLAEAKALINATTPATAKYTEENNKAAYDTVDAAIKAAEKAVEDAQEPKTETYKAQRDNLKLAIAKAAYEDAKAKTTAKAAEESTPESAKAILNAGLTEAAELVNTPSIDAYKKGLVALDKANAKAEYQVSLDKANEEKFNTLLTNLKLDAEYKAALTEITNKVTDTVDSYKTGKQELDTLVTTYEAKARTTAKDLYDKALQAAKDAQTANEFNTKNEVKTAFDQAVTAATIADADNATAYDFYDKSVKLNDALAKARLDFAKANYDDQVKKVNDAIADGQSLASVKEEMQAALTAAEETVKANTVEAYNNAKASLELAMAKGEYHAELLVAKSPERTNVYNQVELTNSYNEELDKIEAKVNDQTTANDFTTYTNEVKQLVTKNDASAKEATKTIFDLTKKDADKAMMTYNTSDNAVYTEYTTAVSGLADPTTGTDLEQAQKYLEQTATVLKALATAIYKVNLTEAEKVLETLGDDAQANGDVEAYNAKSTLEAAINSAKALVNNATAANFEQAANDLKQAVEVAKLAYAKHEYQLVLAYANSLNPLYALYASAEEVNTYNTAITNAKATLTQDLTVDKYNKAAKDILTAQQTINGAVKTAVETFVAKQEAIIADINSSIEKTQPSDAAYNKEALVKLKSALADAQKQLDKYKEDKAKVEADKTKIDASLAKYNPTTATVPSTVAQPEVTPAAGSADNGSSAAGDSSQPGSSETTSTAATNTESGGASAGTTGSTSPAQPSVVAASASVENSSSNGDSSSTTRQPAAAENGAAEAESR